MSGFLVSSKDDCCCPEMRCCTPETVTATVAGMSGSTTGVNGFYRQNDSTDVAAFESDPRNLWPYVFGGMGNTCDGLGIRGFPEPADIIPENDLVDESCGYLRYEYWYGDNPSTYGAPVDDPVWGKCCFPPRKLIDCSGNTPGNFSWGFQWGGYQILPFDICDDFPEMCARPDGTDWHYGAPTTDYGNGRYAIHDADLNGLYVLHRPDVPLRPQLKTLITRQVPLTDSPYKGVTEAELLYNVDPPREWVYRGDLDPPCWDVLFPPAGDLYCVDYRCGVRNPWYSSSGFGFCVRGKCTTTNQGVTKPHLAYYSSQLGNQTADLYLKLIPKDYETDIHGRFPTWWRVGGVDVHDGGSGYSVGDFLFVWFDEWRPWLGGEIMTAFPRYAPECLLQTAISWVDKYGYSGTLEEQQDGSFVWVLLQRLRVSAVDENGAITEIEVVPIYRYDEYVDAPICTVPKSPQNRREHYVGYGRVLCHPKSVAFPGIGYSVGDEIEFYCDDPPCEVVQNAIATVTDVDDEGGILDWEIKGTDAWRYNSMNFCVSPFTVVDGVCTTSCIKEGEPDERGRYKWSAKSLCGLTWNGVGNPVRVEVNAAPGAGCRQALTSLTLTIARVHCETSIEVTVGDWPFGSTLSSDLGATRMLHLFPPYPACHGGGAVIRPVFGAWGSNESDFGGSLAGAVIEAGGENYCYRDKRHVEPTLPQDVPTLGSGAGARIASFQFSAKHNFPNPAAPYGDTPVASDRFSYFPVTGATIDPDHRGSGYTVGQEFEVQPEEGREVSDMWKASGADTPESCPNGAWYGGERALLNNDGYRSLLYDPVDRKSVV